MYRLFETLRNRNVNNRRTRAIIREYISHRPDIDFDAIKYRNRLRIAATHSHMRLNQSLSSFLFFGWKTKKFQNDLFENYRQAHYSEEVVYKLPYSVAEGFAAKHGIPRDKFLKRIEKQMTATEKLRLQKSSRNEKVSINVDLGNVPLTRLSLYVLSLSHEDRLKRKLELEQAFEKSANKFLKKFPQKLGRVAAILDRSYSSSGSIEKYRRPLAVSLAAGYLLRKASEKYIQLWTPPLQKDLLVTPTGQTDLATPLIEALEWGAEIVIVISDGYENDPPGGFSEIVRVFRKKIDTKRDISIIHMNPVFDAEHYQPKNLGNNIATTGLRDAEDIMTMLEFAQFADGTETLDKLEGYLSRRVQELLTEKDGHLEIKS